MPVNDDKNPSSG